MAGLPEDLLALNPPGWEEMVASLDPAPPPEPAFVPVAEQPATVADIDRMRAGIEVAPVEPVAVDSAVPVEQPLPDFGLDAVSGGDPTAQDPQGWQEFIQGGDQPVDPTVEAFSLERPFESDFETEEDPGQPPPWESDPQDDAEVQIRQLGYEGMAPDERAAAFAEDAEVRRQQAAKREAEELARAARSERDAFDAFQAATAKTVRDREMLRTRLDELSKRDPDTFFSGPMTGRKAFGWVRAILTGLVSPLHGLAALKASMDDDLQIQERGIKQEMLGLEKADNLLAEELALHGDLYKAKRYVQIAWLQRLPAMLEAEAAKYDPAGSRAIVGSKAAHTARAEATAAMAEWDKENFDRNIKLEEARQKEQAHLREIAKLEEDIRHAKRQESLQAYGISSENRRAQQNRDADMLEKGFVADSGAPGGYRFDEEMAKKLRGPEKPQDVKATLEVEQELRGEVVTDTEGNPLGKLRAKSEEGRAQVRSAVKSYETFRPELAILMDQVKALGRKYGGYGSDRWASEERTAYETTRKLLAEKFARVMQPTGVLTDSDIERASAPIPKVDSWTRNNNPDAVYRTVTGILDRGFDAGMKVELEDFDESKSPTRKYQEQDKVLLAPKPDANSPTELVKEITAPPAPEEVNTPEKQARFLKTRRSKLAEVAKRVELSDERVMEIRSALGEPELQKEWDFLMTSDEAKAERRKRRREDEARDLIRKATGD